MIRILIGRALRWFIDAADDADKLRGQKRPLRRSEERQDMTTEGLARKTGLYPDPAQLRKPVDTPFKRF